MPSPQDDIRLASQPNRTRKRPGEDTTKTHPMHMTFDSQGQPVFIARSPGPEIANTRFARLALDSGLVTTEEIREGLDIVTKVQELGVTKKLAEVLIERGYISPNEATAIAAASKAGDAGGLLAGFQLLDKLGEGGMGAVYRARQVSLDRYVAIKILPDRLTQNEEFVARFEREARIAAKLSHPNIVGAVDAGVAGGKHYFAMEYIDGQSLKQVLLDKGALSESDALDLMVQMTTALEYAWRNGMVHRDVKPENIMFTADGVAKLADLGLAKERNEAGSTTVTKPGLGMGSPHYVAPEQAIGQEVDIRADIYSLGVTFYEAVTGQLPHTGKDAMSIILNRFNERPAPAIELNHGLSRGTSQVIEVMMAHDPNDRYPDPRVLLQDLLLVAAGRKPEFALRSELDRKRAIESAQTLSVRRHTTMVVGRRTPWGKIAIAGTVAALVIAGASAAVLTVIERTHVRPQQRAVKADDAEATRLTAEAEAFVTTIETLIDAQRHEDALFAIESTGSKYDSTRYRSKLESLKLSAGRMADDVKRASEDRAAKDKRYADLIENAREALQTDDYATAIGVLVQAQAENDAPEIAELMKAAKRGQYMMRARDAEKRTDLPSAVELYELALEIDEDGDLKAHVTELRRAIDLSNRLATAARLTTEDRHQEAMLAYAQALEIAEGAEATRIEDLSAALGRTIRYAETISSARHSLSEKDYKGALAHAENALLAKPGDAEAASLIGEIGDAIGPEPEFTNSIGMQFVLIPEGSFAMGSTDGDDDERPVREVSVESFYMARHEVTNAEYEEFSPGHRSKWRQFSPGDEMPVIAVTWEEAAAFCKWLSQKEGVEYRLPTEAQWEKAARGTDTRRYPWGDDAPRVDAAKYRCNLAPKKPRDTWGEDGFELVAPVGSFPEGASPYGCHDMAGNVWEWCLDWYSPTYYGRGPSSDPAGPPHGSKRVLRGGSFTDQPMSLRSSNRLAKPVEFYEANLGFRCVRVLKSRGRSR